MVPLRNAFRPPETHHAYRVDALETKHCEPRGDSPPLFLPTRFQMTSFASVADLQGMGV